MKTKDEDCRERKQPTPNAQASIRCGGAKASTNIFRKIVGSGGCGGRAAEPRSENRQQQQQSDNTNADQVNQR